MIDDTMRFEKEAYQAKKMVEGNRKVFRSFYAETHPKLFAFILKKVEKKEDAEELVQDTFLAFLDSLPLFQGKSSLWTFLVSIARHEVADYWRKRYAKKAILTIPFMDQVYTEKLYSASEVGMAIERAYTKVLPREEKILRMKYEDGLSVKEIATELGVSLKAAESQLFRARQSFQLAYADVVEGS